MISEPEWMERLQAVENRMATRVWLSMVQVRDIDRWDATGTWDSLGVFRTGRSEQDVAVNGIATRLSLKEYGTDTG